MLDEESVHRLELPGRADINAVDGPVNLLQADRVGARPEAGEDANLGHTSMRGQCPQRAVECLGPDGLEDMGNAVAKAPSDMARSRFSSEDDRDAAGALHQVECVAIALRAVMNRRSGSPTPVSSGTRYSASSGRFRRACGAARLADDELALQQDVARREIGGP